MLPHPHVWGQGTRFDDRIEILSIHLLCIGPEDDIRLDRSRLHVWRLRDIADRATESNVALGLQLVEHAQ